jgi:hypothetical protein
MQSKARNSDYDGSAHSSVFPFQIVFKIYRAAAKAAQAYFLTAISLLASPAGEKSKIDVGEKSPFKPAVALSMAM